MATDWQIFRFIQEEPHELKDKTTIKEDNPSECIFLEVLLYLGLAINGIEFPCLLDNIDHLTVQLVNSLSGVLDKLADQYFFDVFHAAELIVVGLYMGRVGPVMAQPANQSVKKYTDWIGLDFSTIITDCRLCGFGSVIDGLTG